MGNTNAVAVARLKPNYNVVEARRLDAAIARRLDAAIARRSDAAIVRRLDAAEARRLLLKRKAIVVAPKRLKLQRRATVVAPKRLKRNQYKKPQKSLLQLEAKRSQSR